MSRIEGKSGANRSEGREPLAKLSPLKQRTDAVKPVVYDAGVLSAADRGERRIWAEHRVRLEAGHVPLVPAAALAQASRSPQQAQLRQLLRGCEVVALGEQDAHRVGALLKASKTRDVGAGTVVALAVQRKADIRTEAPEDMTKLVKAARARVRVVQGRGAGGSHGVGGT